MDIFVARQPIFNTKKQVIAYEILYRNNLKNMYDLNQDGDVATATVVTDALTNFGLKNLTGGKKAFINFTHNLIKEDMPTLFRPEELTVELLENIIVDEQLVEKCKTLKNLGYTLALDDFTGGDHFDMIMPYIDIVKVDFLVLKSEGRKYIAKKYLNKGITLLAEKVESIEDFEEAVLYGYQMFQGFFFEKPVVCQGKGMNISTFKYMEILKETVSEEPDFHRLSDIVKSDLSLTYKLLRLINSPAFYTVGEITSVGHALTLLGINEIRKWTTLIMLRDISRDKPDEIVRISLIRATFAEKISPYLHEKNRQTEAFLLGLFSLIDTIMEKSLYEILEELPLKDDLKDALLGGDNHFHDILKLLKYYEIGNWDMVMSLTEELGIDYHLINEIYLNSIVEATKKLNEM